MLQFAAHGFFCLVRTNADALTAVNTAVGVDLCMTVFDSDRFRGAVTYASGATRTFFLIENNGMSVIVQNIHPKYTIIVIFVPSPTTVSICISSV